MEEKKLFLLDAYALIYRAYYALVRSPRFTAGGMNTSAVFGFYNTLDDLLRKENPGYIAVCFDPPHGRTFRHEKFEDYKAGRDKQPEDITIAIPIIKDLLNACRIPVIEMENYEADDVIGTLAAKAEKAGFTTYMMTPDKDYGQLVTDHTFMYRPAIKGQGFEVRGPREVCERYGISNPRQVIDLLALEGDASDNVPGCPGVGEKTAAKLIAEFGSVENLLDNTDALKGALKTKIVDNAEQIRLSKWLVTICTDVPVEFDEDALRRREPDIASLTEIFKKLEFKTFLARFTAESRTVPATAPVTVTTPSLFDLDDTADAAADTALEALEPVEMIADAAGASEFITKAASSKTVAISLIAAGTEAMTATLHGMALAYMPAGSDTPATAYITLNNPATAPEIFTVLEPLFTDPELCLCGHDIKRAMVLLRRHNIEFTGVKVFDTAVAHYVCSPETKHDTATLAMNYLGFRTFNLDAPAAPVTAQAAAQTAAVILRLREPLTEELRAKGQWELVEKIEFPLIGVLASMEWEGVRIDSAELGKLSVQLSERVAALEAEAYAIARHPFNIGSPAQVGTVLFDELKIDPKARKTKSGAWSTAEDVLEKYARTVPLVQLILDIRGLRKLLATYIDALPKLVNPHTGKIHTTYNQTVTSTGRISSTNPNLQNIPIRSADGRDIRRAFVADPGCLLLSADYSQIELRLMADVSADPDMREAFLSGQDIHRATAAKIYHLKPQDVTDNQRRNAKTANFGIIYGISAFGLSERLGIPRAEAKELIDGYLRTYPQIDNYIKQVVEQARRDGYVSTVMGRRRYLPDINSRSHTVRAYAERNAVNAPLQGSAADIIKLAMVRIDAEIRRRGLRSRMIMQVHDELIFNVVPEEAEQMQTLVTTLMEKAYTGTVPMEVASGMATNWLDAH